MGCGLRSAWVWVREDGWLAGGVSGKMGYAHACYMRKKKEDFTTQLR